MNFNASMPLRDCCNGRPNRAPLEQALERTRLEFGKIGLLVDDSPLAASAVARELYGTETLPRWWLVVRSAGCARLAITHLVRLLTDPRRASGIQVLVVFDRFLPPLCDSSRPAGAKAWDNPGPLEGDRRLGRIYHILTRRICALRRLHGTRIEDGWPGRSHLEIVFMSSYPHESLGEPPEGLKRQDEEFPWRRRSIEVLFRLRRKLADAGLRPLLEFGPAKDAPVTRQAYEAWLREELEPAPSRRLSRRGRPLPRRSPSVPRSHWLEADAYQRLAWNASTWPRTVEALAQSLRHQEARSPSLLHPIVLLTGAGASLPEGRFGAGMPNTAWLIEQACLHVLQQSEGGAPATRLGELPPRPSDERSRGLCGSLWDPLESTGGGLEELPTREHPITFLVRAVRDEDPARRHTMLSRYHLSLDRIFDSATQRDCEYFRPFLDGFREALHRLDHGLPYQHWLLAQLPWSYIITTNVDTFHERAAAEAARTPGLKIEQRQQILRRGRPFPSFMDGPARHACLDDREKEPEGPGSLRASLLSECGLFKPYGDLLSPERLYRVPDGEGGEERGRYGLNPLEGERARLLYEALRRFLGPEAKDGWLVVLGHSMQLGFVKRAMDRWLEERGGSLGRFHLVWVDPRAYSSAGGGEWQRHMQASRRARLAGKENDGAGIHTGPMPGTAIEFAYDVWTAFQRLPPAPAGKLILVRIIHAREDASALGYLTPHLTALNLEEMVVETVEARDSGLKRADVIILLLSVDLVNACPRLIEDLSRLEAHVRVIPVHWRMLPNEQREAVASRYRIIPSAGTAKDPKKREAICAEVASQVAITVRDLIQRRRDG